MSKQVFFSMIVTFCGCGYVKVAPGTFGSLVGAIFLWVLFYYLSWYTVLFLFIILFILGLYATHFYIKNEKGSDPKEVVIDEVLGMFVTVGLPILFFDKLLEPIELASLFSIGNDFVSWFRLNYNFIFWVLSFVFFRYFDIKKPFWVGWADQNLSGSWGIIADDLIAGIFSTVILLGITYLVFM